MKVGVGIIIALMVSLVGHPAEGAPTPGPGSITDSGARGKPANKAASDALTSARVGAGSSGRVVAGPGHRPSISMVRSIGATTCRTSGIVPPLGAGRFGEPGIGGIALCPNVPGQPAPAAPPPPTPLEAAYYAWLYIIRLPSPTGKTQPTIGITGLDTFLTIGGPQTLVVDVPALGHAIHFDISSIYDVTWGDPRPDGSRTGSAVTRRHPDQGGPYPNGTLRHQYIERGTATITITQRWSANWSGGGESGSLPDSVETDGRLTLRSRRSRPSSRADRNATRREVTLRAVPRRTTWPHR